MNGIPNNYSFYVASILYYVTFYTMLISAENKDEQTLLNELDKLPCTKQLPCERFKGYQCLSELKCDDKRVEERGECESDALCCEVQDYCEIGPEFTCKLECDKKCTLQDKWCPYGKCCYKDIMPYDEEYKDKFKDIFLDWQRNMEY